MESKLDDILNRLCSLEETVRSLVNRTMTKGEMNAVRRQYYRKQRAARERGKLALPDVHVLTRRDRRIERFVPAWADAALKFGAANDPEGFLSWLTYEWNNCYLKKPITFSGSSFRVWTGHCRHPYGAGDLMHYYASRKVLTPFLRTEAEYQDWRDRPWHEWGYYVLYPVVEAMEGFDDLPERFQRLCKLLMGGFGGLKVASGLPDWDVQCGRDICNKQLRHVVVDYRLALRACYHGLKRQGPPVVPE
jgi:hypothetical protein